jgi:transcriptional regulator with XRE-family HTH domain
MTPAQCKMARAGLGWSVQKLGQLTGVTPNTVSRYENGKDGYQSTVDKLKNALEVGGARFKGGCCVCLGEPES